MSSPVPAAAVAGALHALVLDDHPHPAEITRLTGLTDQDFRPCLERLVPAATTAAWACSWHDVPWDPDDFPSRSLACLLCTYGAFSPERHRALADCEAGVWLLTQPLPGEDRTVFAALREPAATPTVRVWALGAPFDANDKLKAKRYRREHGRVLDPDELPRHAITARDRWRAVPLETGSARSTRTAGAPPDARR